MKRIILFLIFCALPLFAQDDLDTAVQYIYKDNTNFMAWMTAKQNVDNADNPWAWSVISNQLEIVKWDANKLGPKKTKEELSAVLPQARAWKAGAAKDSKASLDEISPEVMKAMLTAMIKVINQRLPAGQKITAEEMKTAIKAELP